MNLAKVCVPEAANSNATIHVTGHVAKALASLPCFHIPVILRSQKHVVCGAQVLPAPLQQTLVTTIPGAPVQACSCGLFSWTKGNFKLSLPNMPSIKSVPKVSFPCPQGQFEFQISLLEETGFKAHTFQGGRSLCCFSF